MTREASNIAKAFITRVHSQDKVYITSQESIAPFFSCCTFHYAGYSIKVHQPEREKAVFFEYARK